MIYLKIKKDGTIEYPYSINQLKNEYPNTSFPQDISDCNLIDYNIHQVIPVSNGNDLTKNYIETIPIYISGIYYQNWLAIDMSSDEIESRINNQWSSIRIERNNYLSECDWTQLSDSQLTDEEKTEWITYRQDLRDITLQEDPFNITWPTKP